MTLPQSSGHISSGMEANSKINMNFPLSECRSIHFDETALFYLPRFILWPEGNKTSYRLNPCIPQNSYFETLPLMGWC